MDLRFLAFGNHPRLSLAEFLAVSPNSKLIAQSPKAIVLKTKDWEDDILMARLGGTIKLGDIIWSGKNDDLTPEAIADLMVQGQDFASMEFGWTVFGADGKQKKAFEKFPIRIKNALKALGWKPRWVSSQDGQPLSPAAVAKCHLTKKPNADLCLIIGREESYLGRTTQVQDADAWSLRDYGRPYRDDENGMLPPKLARMLINLAQVPKDGCLLDPFCGSGTVLMEAALATPASKILGSDIDSRQTYDSQSNLDWLAAKNILRPDDMPRFRVFESDVKSIAQHIKPKSVDAVVTEGWLGPPLRGHEPMETVANNAAHITDLWVHALKALRPLLKPKGCVVGIFPSFKKGSHIISTLHGLDLASLGFKMKNLPENIRPEELYYERTGQHLRRNILVLEAA